MALAYSSQQVDIGGSNHADIDFARRRGTDRNYLAILEDTQKLDLHGERQLANLVKKDGAAIGLFEIALAVFLCASKRTLNMAKEFTLNGSLRNCAAVDGDQLFVFTAAVVMYHSGKDLLTDTTLTSDEDAEVCRSHLDGFMDGQQQVRVVAYNVISVFYCL